MTFPDPALRRSPPAAGPPCDLCRAEPAIESVMHLATYETVMIGLNCLLVFHQGVVASMTEPGIPMGVSETAGGEPDTEPGPPPVGPAAGPADDGTAPAGRGSGRAGDSSEDASWPPTAGQITAGIKARKTRPR